MGQMARRADLGDQRWEGLDVVGRIRPDLVALMDEAAEHDPEWIRALVGKMRGMRRDSAAKN